MLFFPNACFEMATRYALSRKQNAVQRHKSDADQRKKA